MNITDSRLRLFPEALLCTWPDAWKFEHLRTQPPEGASVSLERLLPELLGELLRPADPKALLERLLQQPDLGPAQALLRREDFRAAAGPDQAQLERALQAALHRDVLKQQLQALKGASSGERPQPTLPPLFPFQESPRTLVKWMLEPADALTAPPGFTSKYRLCEQDSTGKRILEALQTLWQTGESDGSVDALEVRQERLSALLGAVAALWTEQPEPIEAQEGVLQCVLRGCESSIPGLQAERGVRLVTPCSSTDGIFLAPGPFFWFDPLELRPRSAPEAPALTVSELVKVLSNPEARADWLLHELERKVPLRKALPEEWIQKQARVSLQGAEAEGYRLKVYEIVSGLGIADDPKALAVLDFLTGSVPYLTYFLLREVLLQRAQNHGQRYRALSLDELSDAWFHNKYSLIETSWLEEALTQEARHCLTFLVEDAQTITLEQGFPRQDAGAVAAVMSEKWPDSQARDRLLHSVRELLMAKGLLEQGLPPSVWQLRSCGPVWRRVLQGMPTPEERRE